MCPHGSVVCIGAFDGLHLGHQALVGRACARARELGCASAVLSFEPLPREFFAHGAAPARLLLPAARIRGLSALGIDAIGMLRFNPQLAAMSAQAFVESVLVQRLGAREVWVGPGFRFGHGREGDLALLQALGEDFGFTALSIESVALDGERVSASRIRDDLAAGDLAGAARLLGRPYIIEGRVVRGAQLGRRSEERRVGKECRSRWSPYH